MARREALPVARLGQTFRVDDALAAGVSTGRLRSADLAKPFHGVRVVGPAELDLVRRCRALATRLDARHAFSGPTAAMLWGVPLPKALEGEGVLHVSCEPGGRSVRRQGVVGSERPPAQVTLTLSGLRVVSPLDCWRDLGRVLDVCDLVAAGDFLVTGTDERDPLVTLDRLRHSVEGASGRGVVVMRRALPLVRVGAMSRPESLLRLAVTAAGVPAPQLSPQLRLPSRHAHPDLFWPEFGVAVEYQGRYHAKPSQWARDVRRMEHLADAGIDVIQVLAADLYGATAATVSRIASHLRRRGWVAPADFDPTKTVRLRP